MAGIPDFSQWGKLKARIQQAAECKLRNNGDGLAIVTVKIIMNASGEPVNWIEPYAERIEPSNKSDLLQRLCAGD